MRRIPRITPDSRVEKITSRFEEKLDDYSAIMARALADRLADAGACTECAACEQACTQHLNIIDRLKEILSPQIEIREVNHHINDITFGRIAAEMMDAMVQKK